MIQDRFSKMSKTSKIILLILMITLTYLLIVMKESFASYGLGVNGPLTGLSADAWSVVTTPIFSIGFIGGFVIYSRYGSRVGGVVAVPLAVVESLAYPLLIPFIIIGSIVSYMIGVIIFEEYLIYGRRLFYVFLIASVFFMTGPIISTIPHGFNFSTILPGIIAYNMHVEKAMTRSIAILLISFSALFLIGLLIIDVYKLGFYV